MINKEILYLDSFLALRMYYALLSVFFVKKIVSTNPLYLSADDRAPSLFNANLYAYFSSDPKIQVIIFLSLNFIGFVFCILSIKYFSHWMRFGLLLCFSIQYQDSSHDVSGLILPGLVLGLLSNRFVSLNTRLAYRMALAAFYSQYINSGLWKLFGFAQYFLERDGVDINILRDLSIYIFATDTLLSPLWMTSPTLGNSIFIGTAFFQIITVLGCFYHWANIWIGLSLVGFHIATQYAFGIFFEFDTLLAIGFIILPMSIPKLTATYKEYCNKDQQISAN